MRKALWAITVVIVSVAMAAGCAVQKGGTARSVTCSACGGSGQSQTADPSTGLTGKCATCEGTGQVSGRSSGAGRTK